MFNQFNMQKQEELPELKKTTLRSGMSRSEALAKGYHIVDVPDKSWNEFIASILSFKGASADVSNGEWDKWVNNVPYEDVTASDKKKLRK